MEPTKQEQPDWLVVRPSAAQRDFLAALLRRLHPDRLDEIEVTVRKMRETFPCPSTVREKVDFKDVFVAFYAHYTTAFYGVPFYDKRKDDDAKKDVVYHMAQDFFSRVLTAYPGDLYQAERNAIKGWNGGMVGVVDALTTGLVGLHIDNYITPPYHDLAYPEDVGTRYWVTEQLLKQYGHVLFREDLLCPAFYGSDYDLKRFLPAFALRWRALRKQLRV